MDKLRIGVLAAGRCNHGSVKAAIERNGYLCDVIDKPEKDNNMNRLIIPGVGNLKGHPFLSKEWKDYIKQYVKTGNRLLGICMGFQILFEFSEEANEDGLGLLEGEVVRLRSKDGINITNTGNRRTRYIGETKSNEWAKDEQNYYYTHSYGILNSKHSTHESEIKSDKGNIKLVAAAKKGNIYGCQFHPELSKEAGRSLLMEFIGEQL